LSAIAIAFDFALFLPILYMLLAMGAFDGRSAT
jgi:hypothetical protein